MADPNKISEALVQEAMKRLLVQLGERRVVLLAKLIDDVGKETRYGDVKIIVADGRVRNIKAEKSYE